MVVSNRNLLFQGSIFRGYVSFREGILLGLKHDKLGCSMYQQWYRISETNGIFTCIHWSHKIQPRGKHASDPWVRHGIYHELVLVLNVGLVNCFFIVYSVLKFSMSHQWLFQVPLKGGRWHIILQLAVYTTCTYIYIYHLYIAFWGVICYLPPFRGTRTNHWSQTGPSHEYHDL